MKKLVSNTWMKLLVTVLCILSMLATAACTIGMVVLADCRSEDELRQQAYEKLNKNYTIAVLSELYQHNPDELSSAEKQLLYEKQESENWHYALITSRITDDFQFEKLAPQAEACTYLYGNPDIWEHDVEIWQGDRVDGVVYGSEYSTDSLFEALFGSTYLWLEPPEGKTYNEAIADIVYLSGSNLFYVKLENGNYFTLDAFTATYFDGETFYSVDYELGEFYDEADEPVDHASSELSDDLQEYVAVSSYDEEVYNGAYDADNPSEKTESAIENMGDYLAQQGFDYDDGRFHANDPRLIGLEISGYPCTVTFPEHMNRLEQRYGEDALIWYEKYSDTSGVLFDQIYYIVRKNEIMSCYMDISEYSIKDGTVTYVYLDESVQPDIYWLVSYVDEEWKPGDLFYEAGQWLDILEVFWKYQIWWLLLSVAVWIASMVFLVAGAGRSRKSEGIYLRWYDKMPYGLFLTGIAGMEMLACTCMVGLFEGIGDINPAVILPLLLGLLAIMAFFAIGYIVSTVARFKSRRFFHYTLCYWLWKPIRFVAGKIRELNQRTAAYMRDKWSLFWRVLFLLTGISVLKGIIVLIAAAVYAGLGIGVAIVLECAEIVFLMCCVLQFVRLQKGTERIAQGNLAEPIDTAGLMWDFKKHAENINKVGDGIGAAVEQQMKSERFRMELITNVSHDIKTPLTSIINYVDLMKKEPVANPTLNEYIGVLDRQSGRLKKLIEDLMEASKASTGNLPVHLEVCDVTVLLTQMIGEFEEKAQQSNLTFVGDYPSGEVYIMADSRHIWRVLDNLLNNICKYAMPGTRVYICLYRNGGNVCIVFKNISKTQLNISSEELMERFVRGDSSRNTEGSGLGLPIAQSLTGLMNGTLALDIDGDLFKVTLSFPEKSC